MQPQRYCPCCFDGLFYVCVARRAFASGKVEGARLDLTYAMKNAAASQIKWQYLQIVCVKRTELAEYQSAWPDLNFFALPDDASDLGIGASRFYMKKLATQIHHPSFPYCMFLDDSVFSFKGVTLVDDPHQPFAVQSTDEAQVHDISLRDIIEYFSDQAFTDLPRFGTVGFMVWRGPMAFHNAYLRGKFTEGKSAYQLIPLASTRTHK